MRIPHLLQRFARRQTLAPDSRTLTRCPSCGAWNRALAGEPVMRGSYCMECGARIPANADEPKST